MPDLQSQKLRLRPEGSEPIMTLRRDVTVAECPWLDRDYRMGETVHRYYGHTYGCITPSGIPVSEHIDKPPFFELPDDAVWEV